VGEPHRSSTSLRSKAQLIPILNFSQISDATKYTKYRFLNFTANPDNAHTPAYASRGRTFGLPGCGIRWLSIAGRDSSPSIILINDGMHPYFGGGDSKSTSRPSWNRCRRFLPVFLQSQRRAGNQAPGSCSHRGSARLECQPGISNGKRTNEPVGRRRAEGHFRAGRKN
jgi:hypothetical protein